jgi:hypothetical protein
MGKKGFFKKYMNNAQHPHPYELNQKFEFKHHRGGSMNCSNWSSTIEFDF